MQPFNGSSITPNGIFDPTQDGQTPNLRLLSSQSIASPAGLAGCNGVDTALLHGDQWDVLEQNRYVMINGSWSQTTKGSKDCTVLLDRITTTNGKRNDTVLDATVRTHVGPTAHNYIAPHVESHSSPRMKFEPQEWLIYVKDWVASHTSITSKGMKYSQIWGTYLSLVALYLDFGFDYIGERIANYNFSHFNNEAKEDKNELVAVSTTVRVVEEIVEDVALGVVTRFEMLEFAKNSISV